VRQLAAALPSASLLAARNVAPPMRAAGNAARPTRVAPNRNRKRASGFESGSKLPHSKALMARPDGGDSKGETVKEIDR